MMMTQGEGGPVDSEGGTRFFVAAAQQGHARASLFIGMSVLKRAETPELAAQGSRWLWKAAEGGASMQAECIPSLGPWRPILLPMQENGVKVDFIDPLWDSIIIGQPSVTEALLTAERRSKPKLEQHLMIACHRGQIECVECLLRFGVSVDARMPGGRSPLMHAARHGNLALVQLLVEWKADLTRKTNLNFLLPASTIASPSVYTLASQWDCGRTALDLVKAERASECWTVEHAPTKHATHTTVDRLILERHPWAAHPKTFAEQRQAVIDFLFPLMNQAAEAAAAELLGELLLDDASAKSGKSGKNKAGGKTKKKKGGSGSEVGIGGSGESIPVGMGNGDDARGTNRVGDGDGDHIPAAEAPHSHTGPSASEGASPRADEDSPPREEDAAALAQPMSAKARRKQRKKAEARAAAAGGVDTSTASEGAADEPVVDATEATEAKAEGKQQSPVDSIAPQAVLAEATSSPVANDECVICMDGMQSHVIVPCGHQCICGSCVDAAMQNGCPICRAACMTTVRVFKVS
jgi:hypothetical protein